MEVFKIEEGVPVPKSGAGRPRSLGKYERLVTQMTLTTDSKTGSSVLLSGKKARRQSAAMRTAFRNKGYSILTRQVEGGIRVWKVGKSK